MSTTSEFKTLKEVTTAVEAGVVVCWKNSGYRVHGNAGMWYVSFHNGHTVGLYWTDGVTSDYLPEDFFILERWKIRVWDGFSSWDIIREGSYEQVYNSCAGYPAAYIWTVEPA
ncbi:hypothetical protein Xoosp13_45 [Xanthomonas phage Xoo-sp13]|nr:hypothetical protein Xoosp13_45 [Xanthomonas phage Xoo-sp13]